MSTNLAVPDEKKKIFKPDSIEELFKGWLLHAHKGRDRHDLAARRYDQLRIRLGGTAAVVSAIVATSASISAALPDTPPNGSYIKIIVAILGTLSAILISLSTFLNLAERAEKHRSAGVRYKEIIWELEKLITSPSIKALTIADPAVTAVQKNMKELEAIAPVVPEKIYERVERERK